jgi:hypothetical protein
MAPASVGVTLLQLVVARAAPPSPRARAFSFAQSLDRLRRLDLELRGGSSVSVVGGVGGVGGGVGGVGGGGGGGLLLAPPEALLTPLGAAAAACAAADAAGLARAARTSGAALLHHAAAHRERVAAARAEAGAGAVAAADCGTALARSLLLAASLRLLAASAEADAGAESPLWPRRGVLLAPLARSTAEDVRAFCVEKFGAAPEVEVEIESAGASAGAGGARAAERALVGVPELLRFALAELLKNAMRATVERFTAAGADDAPPVRVRLRSDTAFVHLSVEDAGVGLAGLASLPPACGGSSGGFAFGGGAFPLFLADARAPPARAEVDYKYSREFGAPFSGLGLGLARADVYARLHGGGLSLSTTPEGRTLAQLSLQRDGGVADLDALAALR